MPEPGPRTVNKIGENPRRLANPRLPVFSLPVPLVFPNGG